MSKYAAFKKHYPFDRIREVLDAPVEPSWKGFGGAEVAHAGKLRVRDLPNTDLKDLYAQARSAKAELDIQMSALETQIAAYTLLLVQRTGEWEETVGYPEKSLQYHYIIAPGP